MSHELGIEHQNFHKRLVKALLKHARTLPPFNGERQAADTVEEDSLFLQRLETVSEDLNASEQGYPLGQWIISTIVARYPHVTPHVPRDLFWFFGGDCMNYLGEEEIHHFQRLDEIYYTQDCESDRCHSYESLRSTFLGLH